MSVWHNRVNGGYHSNSVKIEYSFHHCRKPHRTGLSYSLWGGGIKFKSDSITGHFTCYSWCQALLWLTWSSPQDPETQQGQRNGPPWPGAKEREAVADPFLQAPVL